MPLHLRRDHFDPVAEMAEIREEDGGIRRVAIPGDTRTPEERRRAMAGQMLLTDPPEHTRLRRFLTPEFTVRRMKRLEPRIVEIVDEHLDALEAAGSPADLVPAFALPIPSLVICELLGVPTPTGTRSSGAPRASSTSRSRWRSASRWRRRAAPTWAPWSPGPRPIPARTCSGCSYASTVPRCLGAPLARMEMRIAFPALLRRFPGLAMGLPFDEVPFRAFHFIYGLHSLPVMW